MITGPAREKIINVFNSVPNGFRERFALTPHRSTAKVLEAALTHPNPNIGLSGLGRPENLKILEIGCSNLDMAFAAALSGVKNYYINGTDPEALSFAAAYIAKAGLKARIVPGDVMNISLDGSYNVFLCREMLRHFLPMSPEGYMGIFLRPMRSYFVETIVSYNEDHDMYSNLLRAGCTMEVIRPVPEGQPSADWYVAAVSLKPAP